MEQLFLSVRNAENQQASIQQKHRTAQDVSAQIRLSLIVQENYKIRDLPKRELREETHETNQIQT